VWVTHRASRLFLASAAAVATLVLAGCGRPPTSQAEFVARSSGEASYLGWTRSGGALSGVLIETWASRADPSESGSRTYAFTGTVAGQRVELTLDSGATVDGTLRGSALVVAHLPNHGTRARGEFEPSSFSAYDALLARLQAPRALRPAGAGIRARTRAGGRARLHRSGHAA
jgi:hypothetical protein